MNKFTQELTVTDDHIDDLNHVNNVQYLNWTQDIAKSHWAFLIKDFKYPYGIWVVRNHYVNYRLGAFLGDKIEVSTYIDSLGGPICNRVVEFFNKKSNKLIVKVLTKWCYMKDLDERKISTIPVDIIKLFDPFILKVK